MNELMSYTLTDEEQERINEILNQKGYILMSEVFEILGVYKPGAIGIIYPLDES